MHEFRVHLETTRLSSERREERGSKETIETIYLKVDERTVVEGPDSGSYLGVEVPLVSDVSVSHTLALPGNAQVVSNIEQVDLEVEILDNSIFDGVERHVDGKAELACSKSSNSGWDTVKMEMLASSDDKVVQIHVEGREV